MDLQEVGGGCGDWMELAQEKGGWRALVNTVMNFLSLSNGSTDRGGPRPPSSVSSILPGLGRLFSNFYSLTLLRLRPLYLPNAACRRYSNYAVVLWKILPHKWTICDNSSRWVPQQTYKNSSTHFHYSWSFSDLILCCIIGSVEVYYTLCPFSVWIFFQHFLLASNIHSE